MVAMAILLRTNEVLQFEHHAWKVSVTVLADPRVRTHLAHTQNGGGAPYLLFTSIQMASRESVGNPVQPSYQSVQSFLPASGYTSRYSGLCY